MLPRVPTLIIFDDLPNFRVSKLSKSYIGLISRTFNSFPGLIKSDCLSFKLC